MKPKKKPVKQFNLPDLHKFFSARDKGGKPESYIGFNKRSISLVKLIEKHYPDKSIHIMELGCNVGRNLEFLRRAGYSNLHGIEINSHAVGAIDSYFPDLRKVSKIYTCAIEDTVEACATNTYDLTFTMAVLMHIHPDSDWVFAHIARMTCYLLTIEMEYSPGRVRWPRDYGKVFTELGATELCSGRYGDIGTELLKYTYRMFDCKEVT